MAGPPTVMFQIWTCRRLPATVRRVRACYTRDWFITGDRTQAERFAFRSLLTLVQIRPGPADARG